MPHLPFSTSALVFLSPTSDFDADRPGFIYMQIQVKCAGPAGNFATGFFFEPPLSAQVFRGMIRDSVNEYLVAWEPLLPSPLSAQQVQIVGTPE